jgi:hypothetical protein
MGRLRRPVNCEASIPKAKAIAGEQIRTSRLQPGESQLIRAWLILFAGLYLLVFHVLWASHVCLTSLCLPPSPIVPPSAVVVAWADLIVGILYVAIGVRGVWPRSGAKAS